MYTLYTLRGWVSRERGSESSTLCPLLPAMTPGNLATVQTKYIASMPNCTVIPGDYTLTYSIKDYLRIQLCPITSYHLFLAFLATWHAAAVVILTPFCIVFCWKSIRLHHYLGCVVNSAIGQLVCDIRGKFYVVWDEVWRQNIYDVPIKINILWWCYITNI